MKEDHGKHRTISRRRKVSMFDDRKEEMWKVWALCNKDKIKLKHWNNRLPPCGVVAKDQSVCARVCVYKEIIFQMIRQKRIHFVGGWWGRKEGRKEGEGFWGWDWQWKSEGDEVDDKIRDRRRPGKNVQKKCSSSGRIIALYAARNWISVGWVLHRKSRERRSLECWKNFLWKPIDTKSWAQVREWIPDQCDASRVLLSDWPGKKFD